MKLILSSLLLASLCAISSWTASSTGVLVVTQTPDVSVLEGETVNITCCWKGTFERMTFNWGRNQTIIKTDQYNSTPQSEESNSCSTLTFSNITTKYSGKYTCKLSVEIPVYVQGEGKGTVITVKTRENRGDDTDDGQDPHKSIPFSIIIAVAVVVPLLLITLIYFCSLRRRQAQAARVIYEVPHVDSEVAEMDKDSTSSSRGSSQWCQVPVYESFDYFERVQTKESG
ncbi:uncharacterized protein LOC111226878 [Seriola dumerili]|uniref:uncharacterized protein LOC111226878 n=1 Tax=Seriola dumerili TaxID=41447 RepID=UPI000BBF1533|nr:uncharacterized protein LOC111226878 [Seriola dumerili]